MKLQDNKFRGKKPLAYVDISVKCVEKFFSIVICFEFFDTLENFSLIWRHHGEGLQILTYARHSYRTVALRTIFC